MKHATLDDIQEVKNVFAPHLKTYFPHIRADYIKRQIEAGNVILEDGVVIIYGIYKRKQHIGNTTANAGDAHINQIVSNIPGNASKVIQKFYKHVNCDVWLTVREENHVARKFYRKNGMQEVGTTSWMKGQMPGVVYLYENTKI